MKSSPRSKVCSENGAYLMTHKDLMGRFLLSKIQDFPHLVTSKGQIAFLRTPQKEGKLLLEVSRHQLENTFYCNSVANSDPS